MTDPITQDDDYLASIAAKLIAKIDLDKAELQRMADEIGEELLAEERTR